MSRLLHIIDVKSQGQNGELRTVRTMSRSSKEMVRRLHQLEDMILPTYPRVSQPTASVQNGGPQDPVLEALEPIPVKDYRHDPFCRVICLLAPFSRAPLSMTPMMFQLLASYHQIMPEIVDYLSAFGHETAQGARFCGFNTHIQLDLNPSSRLVVSALGRSGRLYQICYNLRTPPRVPIQKSTSSAALPTTSGRMAFRQLIVHHQFDIGRGVALWLLAGGARDIIPGIVDSLVPKIESKEDTTMTDRFRTTLDVHFFNCEHATIDWRECIEFLEKSFDEYRLMLLENLELDEGEYSKSIFDTITALKNLQINEENVGNAVLILHSNIDTMKSLVSFYEELEENHTDEICAGHSGFDSRNNGIRRFVKKIGHLVSEMSMLIRRGERLAQVVADTKNLVIKTREFQNSKQIEILTIVTSHLGYQAQKETIAVRVITIVTLLYLPCSVVSSFFSTDVVKFLVDDNNSLWSSQWSAKALVLWLGVTAVLMALTLRASYIFYRHEQERQLDDLDRTMVNLVGNGLVDVLNNRKNGVGSTWLLDFFGLGASTPKETPMSTEVPDDPNTGGPIWNVANHREEKVARLKWCRHFFSKSEAKSVSPVESHDAQQRV
ncbi:hypothetical protein EJ05DRAFT_478344 [Pseudovirgaria hyperparasitica]|uniref:CorA-like transporter domain-containing protein n=1 Tax=Pseudovirgaria hyperparasitica TaxID=470096 RepID=A0A6A6W169_9PEZI|nr:uncharacterized protein EJ05DRAFT_478344 [Pseudovirgaria hyperparasitica]KAF2755327.1 hypothetical protein EJ05DRAFT_478344 [Pseudovirgaria hyperparasitica]